MISTVTLTVLIVNVIIIAFDYFAEIQSLSTISTLSLIQLSINCFLVLLINKKITFCFIFIIISFIFHQSHFFLESIGYKEKMFFDSFSLFPLRTCIDSGLLILKSNFMLMLGYICGHSLSHKSLYDKDKKNESDLNEITNTAILKTSSTVFTIGLILSLYIFSKLITVTYYDGYLETYNLTIYGTFQTLSFLSLIGFCVWISFTRRDEAFIKKATLAYMLMSFVIVLSGNRYNAYVAIILVFLYYEERIRIKTKPLKIIFALIVVYCILWISISLRDFRSLGIGNISSKDLLSQNLNALDVVLDSMNEFGGEIYNVVQVITYFPSQFSMDRFFSSILIITILVPTLPSIMGIDKYVFYYTQSLPDNFAMGGSYIAEVYFWGGENGCFFLIPLGFLIFFFDNRSMKSLKQYAFIRVSFHLACVFLIRGYFSTFIKDLIWLSVIPIIIYHCYNKKN